MNAHPVLFAAFLETLENEIAESVEEKKVRLCTIYPPFVKSNIRYASDSAIDLPCLCRNHSASFSGSAV